MQADFWHERWQQNQIGFHLPKVHPALPVFWPTLQIRPGCTVLVPLCGKSLDLLWLRAQGLRVIGIELSPLAIESFFAEHRLTPEVTTRHGQERYAVDGLQIYCGDFFDLSANHLPDIHAVYDRAALIALPPEMRRRYAAHLQELTQSATQTLLLTIDYPQEEMAGPPFSVEADEVNELYGASGNVQLLLRKDILAQEIRFRERGVSRMHEAVWHLSARDKMTGTGTTAVGST